MTRKESKPQADQTGFLPPKENKKVIHFSVFVVILVFSLFGIFTLLFYVNRCGEKNKIRVNNVSQVMIHQPHEYTLIVEGVAAVTVYGDPVITYDISPAEKSWAQFTTDPDGQAACRSALDGTLEFHLHPKQVVQGANWKRCYHSSHGGRHCESGATQTVE